MGKSVVTLDGRIWTGLNGEVIERGRVVIKDGKIAAVGPITDFSSDPEGTYFDYSGKMMIPGLMDTHSHLVFGEQGRSYEDYIREDTEDMMLLRANRNALIHQAVGVTTLRDSGSVNNVVLSLREGIRRGYVSGPRILVSARPVTITGGHFWWCNGEADGVEGVQAAVRKLQKDGVDFIKIMASGGGTKGTNPKAASFTQEELCAIVREAHAHGLKCSAHCEATDAVERAVIAGVDTIEHAGFQEPDGTRTYREDIVQIMVEKGLSYSPTIQTAYRGLDRYRDRGETRSPDRLTLQSAHYKLSRKLENLGKMLEAGVTIIAGSDSIGQFGDYVVGLELFVYAGMTAEQALLSATSVAAGVIGLGNVTGALKPGLAADLLIVDGDPLQEISDLRKLVSVIQGGEQVFVPPYIRKLIPETATAGVKSDIAGALGSFDSGEGNKVVHRTD